MKARTKLMILCAIAVLGLVATVVPRHVGRVRQQNLDDKLVTAIWSNDVQKVEHLIAAGANPNAKVPFDDRDLSMLYLAAGHGHLEIANVLLVHGADIQVGDNFGKTPLHAAATSSRPNLEVLKVLVRNGADLNARNSNGQTPLHCAVLQGDRMITRFLLTCGADPNVRDIHGASPLDYLSSGRSEDVVELLKQHGATSPHDDGPGCEASGAE